MSDDWQPIDIGGGLHITQPIGDAVEECTPHVAQPPVTTGLHFAEHLMVVSTADWNDMVAMLEELQWTMVFLKPGGKYDDGCPQCGFPRSHGHAEQCALNNLLKRVKGEAQ